MAKKQNKDTIPASAPVARLMELDTVETDAENHPATVVAARLGCKHNTQGTGLYSVSFKVGGARLLSDCRHVI